MTCSDDNTLQMWSTTDGQLVRKKKDHISPVYCLAFAPDGLTFASGSYDDTLRLWDVETAECLRILEGNSSVYSIAFSHDGSRIISGTYNSTIQLWNSATGNKIG